MLTIISIVLLIVSLLIISFIIVKKFPALAILDVDNIPGQKEAKFKEEIIKKRLERDLAKWGAVFVRINNILNKIFSNPLQNALNNLRAWKISYQKSKKLSLGERKIKIQSLFREIEDDLKAEEWLEAENKLIEIISLDQKKIQAFVELADVYGKLKKWAEARQTLGYALKLIKANQRDEFFMMDVNLPEVYFSLSWVCDNLGDKVSALDNIQEALEFEANNPRYLDYALDLSIGENNLELAQRILERLKLVNPDNSKLAQWEQDIINLTQTNNENSFDNKIE